MGEIADMMLDGTMDPETGEWNFDGEDGPGFPMTGAEAAEFKRAVGWASRRNPQNPPGMGSKATKRRSARRRAKKARAHKDPDQ